MMLNLKGDVEMRRVYIDGGKDMREIIRGVGVVKLGVLDYYEI